MVKAKKGRKTTNDTEDEQTEVGPVTAEQSGSDEEMEPKAKPIKEKPPKKMKDEGKKQKKTKVVNSDSDEEEARPAAKKGGGFALLMDDDDDDDNADSDGADIPDDDEDNDPEPVVVKSKANQDKGGKKGKKNRRKKDDDDEDLDKVLAELELEYSGQKPMEVDNAEGTEEKPSKKGKKQKKGKEKTEEVPPEPMEDDVAADDEEPKAKSATQLRKEKKKEKKKEKVEEAPVDADVAETVEGEKAEDGGDDDEKGKKKKKGKDDKSKDAKGPGKKTIAAMQEALKKIKEQEEEAKRAEQERIKREEEEEQKRMEALRLEKERKERKKQKEKERKERLKAEGKLLTAKQKLDKARAQELINSLKAKGLELPEPGEKKYRPGTRIRPGKSKTAAQPGDDASRETSVDPASQETPPTDVTDEVQVEIVDQPAPEEAAAEDVKDAWDAESSGGEEVDGEVIAKPKPVVAEKQPAKPAAPAVKPVAAPEPPPPKAEPVKAPPKKEEESSEEDDDEDEDESSEEEDSCDEKKTEAEKKRERAVQRIQKRKEDAEKKRTVDELRAAVVCVLGHVDTGKTKILDKLRRTNVQVGEAGGITQQIGATNVPIDNIRDNCKLVKGFAEMELRLPGLLIIDTPGHESFSNLRSRGSSLCDIAILVVDIMHGLEPQTIESINLLKARKTPFVVALNKIDRLYEWQTMGKKDIRDIIKGQADNTQLEFQQRTKEVVVQFAEQGLNAALFYESPDIRSYVSLMPTSAITGEGMGNLLAFIVELCQTMLAKRLMYSEMLQATVLEVKAIPGLGTTIDCILINGKLAEGDTIILAGTDGPVVTQIRSLLMPQPMRELRVKSAYVEYKEIKAAQGVKIAGKDLEKAIAGLNLQVAEKPDEVEIFCEEVARELKSALSSIKLKDRGVYVQASTLGSLEALLEFLRTSKIPVSGIRIGPVVKKDVMKASIMLEHESQYATILAFDVKIERDAQDLADSLGVKIFQADIIYHLFDKFMAYREELKQKKREEFKNIAVFPCRLRILPQHVFNSRDPIVCGVMVEAGIVKEGTPICVPSKEFLNVGVVTSVEQNHKQMESARKGMEVCIKIENIPGETPKLYGRHFDHTDILTSKISRQSIDACKDYFRDDLTKNDWQLMVELKKQFQIL